MQPVTIKYYENSQITWTQLSHFWDSHDVAGKADYYYRCAGANMILNVTTISSTAWWNMATESLDATDTIFTEDRNKY